MRQQIARSIDDIGSCRFSIGKRLNILIQPFQFEIAGQNPHNSFIFTINSGDDSGQQLSLRIHIGLTDIYLAKTAGSNPPVPIPGRKAFLIIFQRCAQLVLKGFANYRARLIRRINGKIIEFRMHL